MDELQTLKREVQELRRMLNFFVRSDRYYFQRNLELIANSTFTLGDNIDIPLGTTTGTKIGTATTQKLGFFNATPIVQVSAIAAPTAPGVAYNQAEATSAVTAINNLRNALSAGNGGIGITA